MIMFSSGQGYRSARFNGGGGIGCLIFGILGMVAAYFVLKGLFKLLYWASPALFVLALVINWRAVTDTFRNWLKSMETNPVGGLLSAALAILLFPVFTFYLFLKALGYSKIQQMQREFGAAPGQATEGEFTEFEEVESKPKTNTVKTEDVPMEPLELPESEAEPHRNDKKPPRPSNPYEEFFEDGKP